MSTHAKSVTIHPYFQIHAGKTAEFIANLEWFKERTATEETCLYYNFTLNGDLAFCREAYVDGDAALAHITNVDGPLSRALELSTMARLELHGPAEELDKMRGVLTGPEVSWFISQTGLEK